eukprot:TRINITY_DN21092_c0_g1_i3.p2 TRINITY_DN21092_c0_g1~~TRINITY_DN21092_c0_g1_i3.p2  ORF type:complete len:210 (+),score=41.11 TRINITY_DN21092_c0_g1_i3:658-1287(+)
MGSFDDGSPGAETRKLVEFQLFPRPEKTAARGSEPPNFDHGGIYVAADTGRPARIRGGPAKDAADASGDDGASPSARTAPHLGTPTELARAVLGEWTRFAAPALRRAVRHAAAAAAAGETAEATSGAVRGRAKAPFLVAMGPKAVSRAVKALAFVSGDLQKEHLEGVPPFVVVPRFWERRKEDKISGKEKTSRLLVLCLVPKETQQARK